MFYVGIYAAIGIANALASVLSVIAQYTGALRASRILFKKLLETVVRATFRFHGRSRCIYGPVVLMSCFRHNSARTHAESFREGKDEPR